MVGGPLEWMTVGHQFKGSSTNTLGSNLASNQRLRGGSWVCFLATPWISDVAGEWGHRPMPLWGQPTLPGGSWPPSHMESLLEALFFNIFDYFAPASKVLQVQVEPYQLETKYHYGVDYSITFSATLMVKIDV